VGTSNFLFFRKFLEASLNSLRSPRAVEHLVVQHAANRCLSQETPFTNLSGCLYAPFKVPSRMFLK
jgi:hypothetical protein